MDSNMLALVCTQPGVVRHETRPMPQAGPDMVLLKVHAVGICGSDIHAFHGRQPMFSYPQVMGHEISAEVVCVGKGVDEFLPGQQVIVMPYAHCGECIACRRGKTNCCSNLSVMGVHRGGALQNYISVDKRYLLPVSGLAHQDAAMIEPYAIAAHAVRRSGLGSGEQALVVGAGAIGLAVADICRAIGAQVILAETNPERLASAVVRFNFIHCVNPLDNNFDNILQSLTNGNGPVVIIDATGNQNSMNSHFERIASGGTIVFVGLHSGDVLFKDLAFHKRETTLCGSRAATKADFEQVIDLALQQKIHLNQLYTHGVEFAQLDQERFNALTSPDIVKAVILL